MLLSNHRLDAPAGTVAYLSYIELQTDTKSCMTFDFAISVSTCFLFYFTAGIWYHKWALICFTQNDDTEKNIYSTDISVRQPTLSQTVLLWTNISTSNTLLIRYNKFDVDFAEITYFFKS